MTSIKPWPSCRHTHPAIDAALELHTRLAAGEISAIEAEVYQAAVDICDRPVPSNEYEAKFSLQHCIAAALHDGRVDFASFGPDARSGLASLRNRVALRVAEPYRSAYPVHWGARVTVRGTDGRQFSAERVDCKGDPEAPITRADLVAKARMLLRFGGLEEGAIEAFIGSILEMPSGRSDWSAIRNVLC